MKNSCFRKFKELLQISGLLLILSLFSFMAVSQKFGITDASSLTPNYLVQIHLNNTSGTLLQLTNSLSGNSSTNGLVFNSVDNGVFNIQIFNQDNGYLSFGTNNTERMRISPNGAVGIGTNNPTARLHVVAPSDPLRLEGLQTSAGNDVLVVDANGVVTKKTLTSANDWSITGNSGTTAATNFIGTTDSIDLVFKVNNHHAGLIDLNNGNTSFGNRSLPFFTLGSNNTAFGYSALKSNTSGSMNTAIGDSSLFSNETGSENTASGFQALFSNTNGSINTANGYQTLFSNLTGMGNTAVGFYALRSNTSGDGNTAVGLGALYSNISAQDNTAMGFGSLSRNTTGSENTATGSTSLENNTTGGKKHCFW